MAWLTVPQADEYVRKAHGFVAALVATGELESHKYSPESYTLVSTEDLDALVRSWPSGADPDVLEARALCGRTRTTRASSA